MIATFKKTAICICLIFLLAGMTGCQKYDVESITLEIYAGDAPEVSVYVITPDLKVVAYEFYYENSFDFHSDPWPEFYNIKEYTIIQDEWDYIIEVLQNNNFMNLPEEINAEGIMDGGSYYIEVTANGKTHSSGGYMPQSSRSFAGARFGKVFDAIHDCLV